jgi:DNA-binding transcriptional LysR family regulator
MRHLNGFYSQGMEAAHVNESFIDRLWRTDRVYPLAALGLVMVACLAIIGYWYISAPTKYLVAVAPRDGVEAKLLAAFGDALREERRDLRLTVQGFEELRDSAQALQDRRVHLAVVRPDVLLPTNGLTIAILREEALIIVAPAGSGIDDFTDLAKKRLGVVPHHEADLPAIESVLSHYDLQLPNVTTVTLDADDVEAAVRSKRVARRQ